MALETTKTINLNGTSTLGGIMVGQFFGTINFNGSITVNEQQSEKLTDAQREAEQNDFDSFRKLVKDMASEEHGK